MERAGIVHIQTFLTDVVISSVHAGLAGGDFACPLFI
jgi:hypothetical protein